MSVIDDIQQADLAYAITQDDGLVTIARLLAQADQRLARRIESGDDVVTITMAHDFADALCVLLGWNRVDQKNRTLDHISMRAGEVTLRLDHLHADLRALLDVTRVDLTCAISCALQGKSVGMMSDLMSVALRRDQFVEAAKLLKAIEADPSKKATYGVPVKVIHCIPENLVELVDAVSALKTDVITKVQTSEHKVFADVASDTTEGYTTTDITGTYLVDVMGEVSIVDEETLVEKYTWRD